MDREEGITEKLQIDVRSSVPIWLQLRNRLIFLISSGYCRPGDRLPTVRELAIDLKINYNTVAKVYQSLIHDGYIVSQRGRGTYVDDVTRPRGVEQDSPADGVIDIMINQCVELGVPVEDIAAQVELRVERYLRNRVEGRGLE